MYSLGDIIRINASRFRDRIAFVCGNTAQTFFAFNQRVNRLVNALYASGLKKGDRLGIISSNRIEFVESYGAAEKGGFVAVPVNYRLESKEIAYIADNAGLSAFIAEGRYLDLVRNLPVSRRYVFSPTGPDPASYEALVASGSPVEPACCIDPHDPVYMMYTGGTTGSPKGVLLDHFGQTANIRSVLIEAAVQPEDALLTVMPLHHIGGKNFAVPHFQRGCTNVLLPAFDAKAVLRTLHEHRIRCVLLAPTMVQMLLDELQGRPFSGANLKTIYYSSAPMPVALLRQAMAAFGPVFMQFYGLTESGPSGTCLLKEDHLPDGTEREQRRLASAGKPMIYSEVEVVDERDNVLPSGQVGEIRIKGDQVMRSYWNNERATAETLKNGWVYSGDYGMIDEDGFIYVVGRKKDVIISGGENIYPREIEEILAAHPGVQEAAVIGVPDHKWGEAVKAVVVLRPGAVVTEEELIAHCKSRLASYKKPQSVEFRDALPKSSLGKVAKATLREPYWHGRVPR